MNIKFAILSILTVCVLCLSACRDTDGPEVTNPLVYDIVCLRSMDKSGSTFTLSKPNSPEIITYHAKEMVDTSRVPLGNRLMLAYNMADGALPYTSGPITAYGYSTVTNDVLRAGVIDSFPDWTRDPVNLTSAWLSENFLNIRAALTYDEQPRSYFVMIDTTTTDLPHPACYLIHRLQKPVVNFERNTYMSVDMNALRKKIPSCQGFELRYNDTKNNYKTIIFNFN